MRVTFGKSLPLAILALALCGCVTVDKVSMEKAQAERIKSVALLPIGESQQVQIINIGGAAGLFGPLGGAIAGSTAAERAKEFARLLNEQNLKMGPPMMLTLQESLAKKGVSIVVLENQVAKPLPDGKGVDYSHIQTSADAILHVALGVTGYVSPQFSTSFQPWTVVVTRLIDAKTKQVLYYRIFSAGYDSPIENVENVPGCNKHTYESAEKLLGDVKGAYKGITACHEAVAQRIVAHLR